MIFAHAAAPVWTGPCGPGGTACRHQVLWSAVLGGLRDCQLGAWNQTAQRQLIEPLAEPFDQALPHVPTERLLVNRLTSPLIAAADAARSGTCVAQQASCILDVLLTAHRRGAVHWAEKNYGPPGDEHGAAIARVLAEMAATGSTQPPPGVSGASPGKARTFWLSCSTTWPSRSPITLRQALPAAWQPVMEAALDEMAATSDLPADRHWSPRALAGLIPAPESDLADADPDTSVKHARKSWPAPDTFSDLIKRWLPTARSQPEAADALIKLGWCTSPAWQATSGLHWVEELIDGNFAAVAGRCYYLTRWLGDLRPILPGDTGTARWRRVVDGLAAAGDNRLARLQQAEE